MRSEKRQGARLWSRGAPRRVAHAHSGVQGYVYLVVSGDSFRGSVQFPIHDLNHVLDLGLPEAEADAAAAVTAHRDQLERYARDHLSIGDGTNEWLLEFGKDRVLASANGTYAILEFRIAERFAAFPSRVVVSYDGIIHAHPDRNARVFVKTERGYGPFRRAPEEGRTFTADNSTQSFTVEKSTIGKNITWTITLMGRRAVKKGRGLLRRLSPAGE